MQSVREIEGSLSAKLHDHAFRLFDVDDVHHVFERERLEVQSIGSVVVSRDSFWITVDHDGLESGLVKRKRCVAAAVVKLDSLPDAVWTRTEDHDLASIGRRCFVFSFVSRVEVRRVRFKLGAARVYSFINRHDSQTLPISTNFILGTLSQVGETTIGQCYLLESSQLIGGNVFELRAFNVVLNVHHLIQLIQKPRIDARETIDLGDWPVVLERVSDVRESLRIGTS